MGGTSYLELLVNYLIIEIYSHIEIYFMAKQGVTLNQIRLKINEIQGS